MYIPKFDYEKNKLTRIDSPSGRTYDTPHGIVPSVTTILDFCKDDADKKFLSDWRQWQGEEQADRIVKNSADIGTLLHRHLECYAKGIDRPGGSNLIRKISKSLADSIIENGFKNISEVWGTEVPLYHPGLYAGTTDSVAVHMGDPAILDYKNARRIRTDDQIKYYKKQVVAYALAHNAVYDTNISKCVIMLVVRDDRNNNENFGKYQEWVVEGKEFDKEVDEWLVMVEKYHTAKV